MNAEIHPGMDTASDASHPALAALLSDPPPGPEAIAEHLDNVETPLLEPGAASFVWYGPADRVELVRWVGAGVDRRPFRRVAGSDLWLLRLDVSDGGRFEYKLSVSRGGHEAWHIDPRNPNRARDPFGENSVCLTLGYQRPAWSLPQGAPAGRIETLDVPSAVFGETRVESLYLPPGHNPSRPPPLVVIHDGADFMTYADLAVSLDNLIAAGDIPPTVAALIQTRDRISEYPRGRRHARYVVEELLPAVSRSHGVSASPRQRVLLGASLGAVAALSTAFRHPGVFGGLVLMSGSFILDPEALAERQHPVFQRIARLVRALHRAPKPPRMRAFVSTGELEGLAGEIQALAEFLRSRDVEVLFKSAWDGHHWHNWRDQLRGGLMWTLRESS